MTWKASIMPDSVLPSDSLVGSMLNPAPPAAPPPATPPPPAPPMWHVLAPLLDDSIIEAMRRPDDPDAESNPHHSSWLLQERGVALHNIPLSKGLVTDVKELALVRPIQQHYRARLTEQARTAREDA